MVNIKNWITEKIKKINFVVFTAGIAIIFIGLALRIAGVHDLVVVSLIVLGHVFFIASVRFKKNKDKQDEGA